MPVERCSRREKLVARMTTVFVCVCVCVCVCQVLLVLPAIYHRKCCVKIRMANQLTSGRVVGVNFVNENEYLSKMSLLA